MRTLARGMSMVLLLVVGPGIATSQVSAQASAVDPASLIGEWRGAMTQRGGGGARARVQAGDYVLTISSVEGNTVRGEVVGPNASASGQFEGTVENGTLYFSTGGTKTVLTIKGESMEGIRQGNVKGEWSLSLSRKK